jgi:hypothetical protein
MQSTGTLGHATLLNEIKRRAVFSPEVDVTAEIRAAKAEAPAGGLKVTETISP